MGLMHSELTEQNHINCANYMVHRTVCCLFWFYIFTIYVATISKQFLLKHEFQFDRCSKKLITKRKTTIDDDRFVVCLC